MGPEEKEASNTNSLEQGLGLTQYDPLSSFEKNPCANTLSRISKRLHTIEMIHKAIEENKSTDGYVLKHVSKKLVSYELCLLAVDKNGAELRFVPEEMKDLDMCETAVRNDQSFMHSDCALSYVPTKILSGKKGQRLYRIAISQNGLAIAHVPKKYITKTLAREALLNIRTGWYGKHYDWPIEHIPRNLLSQELIELSISEYPESLRAVPINSLSVPLLVEFVTRDRLNLQYVPVI